VGSDTFLSRQVYVFATSAGSDDFATMNVWLSKAQ